MTGRWVTPYTHKGPLFGVTLVRPTSPAKSSVSTKGMGSYTTTPEFYEFKINTPDGLRTGGRTEVLSCCCLPQTWSVEGEAKMLVLLYDAA